MPKDSALEKWEYREHTRVKHILLEKYLDAWIPILGRYNPRICYFDGFAGRGEYVDEKTHKVIQTGSPIIALKVADRRGGYFDKLICYFVEKDKDNFDNLEEVLEREKPNIENWQKIEVRKENDEFANVADEIFDYMEKEKGIIVPSFFFVDPFGFSGTPFSTIVRILSNPRTEVFFAFMVRDIARFIGLPELEDTFNTLFGTEKWKGILASSQKPEIALIDLYREQLHEAADVRYSWPFRVCTSDKLQTLYYLLHVTNNYKGHSIMKGIMFNQGAQGDFAYLGPQDIAARSQMRLFDVNTIGELEKYLLERFKGITISYDKIQEEVCVPWYSEPPYIDPQYRQALKELEKDKKITIHRITSKTRGFRGDDRITFPQSNPAVPIPLFSIPETSTRPKVYYKEYQQLNGKRDTLVQKVNDGSIIQRFDKTPLPQKPTDVVCPHFLELKWAYGCPFDCSWCYLKGTFRFRPDVFKEPVIKDYEKIELHTKTFLEEVKIPEILNTGEIADSLMFESGGSPFSKFIVPIFSSQKAHKVLLLSKSPNVKNLLEIEPRDQAIMSFSLNAIPVAERWEKAPPVLKRIEAARRVYEAGYEVRIRIDPMVPIEGWQEHYLRLIDVIFESFVPERITLGSLRGLQSTINGCTDRTWVDYLKESSNWGRKVDFKTRYNMYSSVIGHLQAKYDFAKVALCKETMQMWDNLGMDHKRIRCNCLW